MDKRLASSEGDHRRGLVLGLTMAEVLILLLFILLLASTNALGGKERDIARLEHDVQDARKAVEAMAPIVQAAAHSGVNGQVAAQSIVQRLVDAEAAKREAEALRGERTALASELEQARKEQVAWEALREDARRTDPEAPPAVTLRAALRQVGPNRPGLSELQAQSDRLVRLEEAARQADPGAPPAATLQRAVQQLALRKPGAAAPATATGVLAVVRDAERRLAERLAGEFKRDLDRWNAEFDPENLTIRFNNPEILFLPGEASLRPGFRSVLQDFFPRYLARLEEFRDGLAEVRVEGHTSSEWRGAVNPLDGYFRNMELSQGRTRAVLDFGLRETDMRPEMRDWARGLITANGLSSSRLRLRPEGGEDREASRRVEFRAVMKLREKLMQVVPGD